MTVSQGQEGLTEVPQESSFGFLTYFLVCSNRVGRHRPAPVLTFTWPLQDLLRPSPRRFLSSTVSCWALWSLSYCTEVCFNYLVNFLPVICLGGVSSMNHVVSIGRALVVSSVTLNASFCTEVSQKVECFFSLLRKHFFDFFSFHFHLIPVADTLDVWLLRVQLWFVRYMKACICCNTL